MNMRFTFKSTALCFLLAILLLIGAVLIGHAGGPQGQSPGTFSFAKSKAVDGLLNAVVVDDMVVQYIVLICKNSNVLLGPEVNFPSTSEDNLARTTAECPGVDPLGEICLEGWVFNETASDLLGTDCFPDAPADGPSDLIITKVKNFINTSSATSTAMSAEITLHLGQFESSN